MNSFCVASLSVDNDFRPEDGIFTDAALAVTADARVAAENILQRAREEAGKLAEEAARDADLTVDMAEQEVLSKAENLLVALRETNDKFLDRAEAVILDLVRELFLRMAADMGPEQRIETALKQLRREAPRRMVDAVLHVNPEDLPLLPVTSEWDVKPDSAIPRGACRLEASNGEWKADFDAAIKALTNSLDTAAAGA